MIIVGLWYAFCYNTALGGGGMKVGCCRWLQCIKLCVYSHIHAVKTQQISQYHYTLGNTM